MAKDEFEKAAAVLNEAILKARQTLHQGEQKALGMLAPWPDYDWMLPEMQDILTKRMLGPTGNEPVWIHAYELQAMRERCLGK